MPESSATAEPTDGGRSRTDLGPSPSSEPYTLRRGLFVLGQGIRHAPRMFTLAVAGSALYGVMTAGSAWALGRVTKEVITPSFRSGHVDGGDLAKGAGLLTLVAVLLVVGVVGRRVAAGVVVYDLGAIFRRRVTAQYLRLPLAWHSSHPTGQLLSNANADVEATFQVFAPLPMAIGVVVMLVVAAVAMLLADPVLALIGLCVFPAVFAINVVFQRRMSPRVTRAQRLRAEVSDVAHESFDGALVVKSLGREASETQRFTRSAYELRDANVEVGRTRGTFDPVIEAIPNLGTLAVLAVGTSRAAHGQASVADVVQVAYLFSLLAFPVRALGWVLGELPRSAVGWSRVAAVLQATGQLPFGDATLGGTGAAHLSVENVDYAHVDADGDLVPALVDVSLDVRPGSTVAVVGATGSGKSTLTALLVRLVDPDRGTVRIDGVDLTTLRAGEVALATALVPQQTFLFDDSVRGNITLGDPALTDDDDRRVWEALRLAQADGFVAALAHGLDTQVGERGATLSGGQRQRVALARALVRRPRLLVLDDATSAVDPQVEQAILAGLRDAGSDSTVVVVAYRKATIALADQVVFVEDGRVVDVGTHAELTGRRPGYRHIVDAYERDAALRAASEGEEVLR
ncbi:MAG TPA: ABC transporter ATP-binding protein [Actinomycetales bacterium]|nr:ABC transporter ATP-binding protein [Actinomycetales bacterium]